MVDRSQIMGGVLAGGLSRRMGGVDKSQMDLAGQTMISRVIENLQNQVEQLVVNANQDVSRFKTVNQPVVSDIVANHAGPLAGIHAMLDYAKKTNTAITHIASIAADTPFFPTDFVSRCTKMLTSTLQNDGARQTIIIAKSGGYRHPVFGLWPVSLFASLEEFLTQGDTKKVMAFVQRHPCLYAEFDMIEIGDETIDPFFNINTPLELEKACGIISLMKSGISHD